MIDMTIRPAEEQRTQLDRGEVLLPVARDAGMLNSEIAQAMNAGSALSVWVPVIRIPRFWALAVCGWVG